MFAIIDVETTGLSPVFDRIIEVAIILYDGQEIVETFSTLINPEMQLTPNITKLTGITNESLLDVPKFYEVARKIVELTENKILVAHNARFDYSFLRQSFRRLGYNYYRRQLCTIRLSRKYYPGLPSYSLNGVCRFLKIPHESRHRALNDALLTLELFQRLHARKIKGKQPASTFQKETRETFLPPGICQSDIAALPEETGIYLFYDGAENLIYAGKSNNIRRRVLGHFSGDLRFRRCLEMKERIQRIHYEITGSELIALLRESEIIKKYQPPFNRDQRNTLYLYGLFCHTDKQGYRRLSLENLNNGHKPLLSFSNKLEAMDFLEKLMVKYGLCQKMCGFHKTRGPCFYYHMKRCRGACTGKESPEGYNRRVEQSIQQFDYVFPSFLVIGKGREENEKSVVAVENGMFKGFGYFDPEFTGNTPEQIKAAVQSREDNQDVRRIILRYLRQSKEDVVIRY
jgi:DNA polymerase-3 subunit epsilon